MKERRELGREEEVQPRALGEKPPGEEGRRLANSCGPSSGIRRAEGVDSCPEARLGSEIGRQLTPATADAHLANTEPEGVWILL